MKILVSAGPTREFLDSVRFISNSSSGKMGYAIAAAAVKRGHEVTLVSGPVAIEPPAGTRVVHVISAAQMAAACKRAFKTADAAVMTAAVCDYRPVERYARKRPKRLTQFRLVLEPTEDIAAALGRRKGRRLLVGFAMEDNDPRLHAERKLKEKNCDLIVLNGVTAVGGDRTSVEFFTRQTGWRGPYRGGKAQIALRLVRMIERMYRPGATRVGSKAQG